MRFSLAGLAVMFAVTFAARVASADQIAEISVEENKKTTADTVELIAKIEVGDDWTPDMAEEIKRNLVSSGLFKDVEVFTEPVKGGVKVHILAKDKHSWVIAPALYNQPTNKGGGIGFGENNLFGLNQKLLLYGQIATGDSFFIGAWLIPSIGGTRFSAQFDTFLKSSRNIEYAAPTKFIQSGPDPVRESRIHYLNGGLKLGIGLFRGIRIEGRLRGAKVSYVKSKTSLSEGADKVKDLEIAETDPIPLPGKEGWDVSNEWTLSIDRRANWYGVQSGYKYTAIFEQSLPSLGSDFHYQLATLSIFKAWQVLKRHNFVAKLGVNYGNKLPFQQEFKTGGTSMRGYLNDQFRGDFKTNMNLEYSVPMLTVFGLSVRGLVFLDSAYTTFLKTSNPERNYLPNSQVRGLDGFRNSVGAGTRFYLRQIVLPLLGLDFGYGLEARDFQIYLAIGLTD